MSSSVPLPLPPAAERLLFGFLESQIAFVLHDGGVFAHLASQAHAGASGASCAALSAAVKPRPVPERALRRLLLAATSMRLLQFNPSTALYSLSPEWAPLLGNPNDPRFVGAMFSGHYQHTTYPVAINLRAALQEDQAQWHRYEATTAAVAAKESSATATAVVSSVSIYDRCVFTDAESTRLFEETMWASGYEDSKSLVDALDLREHSVVADLGGASGSFVIPLLSHPRHAHMRGVIMDHAAMRPHALGRLSREGSGVQDRCAFEVGDFFAQPLPPADVYVIGYVLSDWSDSRCEALLRKAFEALPDGGLLLVLEKVFNEDEREGGPYLTAMLNVIMMLEMEGGHKTAAEYTRMLLDAGFTDCRFTRSSGEKHMLQARKGRALLPPPPPLPPAAVSVITSVAQEAAAVSEPGHANATALDGSDPDSTIAASAVAAVAAVVTPGPHDDALAVVEAEDSSAPPAPGPADRMLKLPKTSIWAEFSQLARSTGAIELGKPIRTAVPVRACTRPIPQLRLLCCVCVSFGLCVRRNGHSEPGSS